MIVYVQNVVTFAQQISSFSQERSGIMLYDSKLVHKILQS